MADSSMAVLAVLVLLAAMIIPVWLLLRTQTSAVRDEEERSARAAAAAEVAERKRAARAAEKDAGGNKKKSKGLTRLKKAQAAGAADEDAEQPGEAGGDADGAEPGRRAQRKAERLAEREAERGEREAEREAGNERGAAREAVRRAKDEEREERERQREEERLRKREEEALRAQQEYDSWKGMFEVEEAGDGGAETKEDEGLLARFVGTLKTRKVRRGMGGEGGVMAPLLPALSWCSQHARCAHHPQHQSPPNQVSTLEQLGSEFGLRVTDVLSRLRGLEAMGYVTGVVDDRGKFIYVSQDELEAVGRYIRKKGRVRISALAQESNRLIDLNSHEAVPEEGEGEAGQAEGVGVGG
jgi:hypothetical protein